MHRNDVIDTLDIGEDKLDGLENSRESIDFMTKRNLGMILSGEIVVDDGLKTKFSDFATKLDLGGSSTTKIDDIITQIDGKISDPATGIDAKITDLERSNTTLTGDITAIEDGTRFASTL